MLNATSRITVAALAALLGLSIIATGCKTGPYTASAVQPSPEDTESLVLLDKELVKQLSVQVQRAGFTSDGRLTAEANLRNLTKKTMSVQVQTVFKDAQGLSTGDETAWKTVILNPNAMETYQASALNTRSERYTVRVRKAR